MNTYKESRNKAKAKAKAEAEAHQENRSGDYCREQTVRVYRLALVIILVCLTYLIASN